MVGYSKEFIFTIGEVASECDGPSDSFPVLWLDTKRSVLTPWRRLLTSRSVAALMILAEVSRLAAIPRRVCMILYIFIFVIQMK